MPLARADVRDVCFAHWPVDPDRLGAVLPPALAAATRDAVGVESDGDPLVRYSPGPDIRLTKRA